MMLTYRPKKRLKWSLKFKWQALTYPPNTFASFSSHSPSKRWFCVLGMFQNSLFFGFTPVAYLLSACVFVRDKRSPTFRLGRFRYEQVGVVLPSIVTNHSIVLLFVVDGKETASPPLSTRPLKVDMVGPSSRADC